jgi:crotonobetainyl-CoA:carnitine CoA-transferase CaiB-like acyl-CoA transferase
VPNAQVRINVEMFEDPQGSRTASSPICRTRAMGTVRVLAPPIKLDGDGFQPGGPTGAFASETRAVLRDVGSAEREIDALVKGARRATRRSLDVAPPSTT